MHVLQLDDRDISAVQELCADLAARYATVEAAEFLRDSRLYAQELPRRVRRELEEFRLTEKSGALVVTGLTVDDASLGPTPADRAAAPSLSPSHHQDLAFFLIASLLGDPIGWATQQDGRIMHDIYPVEKYEHDQIGWGSAQTLTWHTEDAFHHLRTDYLGLMCLRNPDGTETTVADVADIQLDEATRRLLGEKRFRILPDDSHRPEAAESGRPLSPRETRLHRQARERVEQALKEPEPVAVLFGDPESPYLVIDPYYMQGQHEDEEQEALDRIGEAIDAAMSGVVLTPGDICFLDNYQVVHGRKPFQARFDGTDRWLRRLNIARDLRRSREYRLSADSRVIH
ncbi:guanitoxin biosynthesis L-enduracididine beta-hydroxylase GntD [Streptomyces koyangensis]